MSFESMKVDELRRVADQFGVDLQGANTKVDILAVIAAEGVQYEDYEALNNIEKVDPAELLDTERVLVVEEVEVPKKRTRQPGEVLVKMVRDNYHFEIFGKTFTKEHPFVVMTEDEAQKIFDVEEGFVLAQPREAAEYYS